MAADEIDDELDVDLEATLAEHSRQLLGSTDPRDELINAVDALARFHFARDRIPVTSDKPGGAAVHQAVGKVVGRQIDGVLHQNEEYARAVERVARLVVDLVGTPGPDVQSLLQQISDLQGRVAEQQRELNRLRHQLES